MEKSQQSANATIPPTTGGQNLSAWLEPSILVFASVCVSKSTLSALRSWLWKVQLLCRWWNKVVLLETEIEWKPSAELAGLIHGVIVETVCARSLLCT